jgi:hypothetical protein
MRDAHRILESLHTPAAYRGSWWPGQHVFTGEMQNEAISYLANALGAQTLPA